MTPSLQRAFRTSIERRGVTVILCTRDRPELLAHALEALTAAVPAGTEILVVDSASTTRETWDVATAAGVRYVRSDIPGLSIARNLGLQKASHDIAVFTDDDCRVESGFLQAIVAPFDDERVGAATGLLRDESDSRPAPADAQPRVHRRTSSGLDAGHGALMAFRVPLMRALGGFDPVLGAGRRFGGAEDLDALCRVIDEGYEVVHAPTAIVTHVYTRNDADYVKLNLNYGRGLGAMCAKWLRASTRNGVAISAIVLRRAVWRFVRRAWVPRSRHAQGALIRGLFEAYREARRMELDGFVFVDTRTPDPVNLPNPPSPAASPSSPPHRPDAATAARR